MKKILIKSLFIILFTINSNQAFSSSTEFQTHNLSNSKTRLIASQYNDNGEKKLISAIEFKLDQGWKIYGNNSDSIGIPPQLDFSSSKNYKNHQIIFPKSSIGVEIIGTEEIKYEYYKDHVIIPIEIQTNNINDLTTLNLILNFAICKDVCMPITHNFSLEVNNEDEEILTLIEKFYPKKLSQKIINSSNDFNDIDMTLNSTKKHDDKLIYRMIIIAIFGGMILNIMPCVLPVLSIKLISIIKHSGASSSKIRLSFIYTIFGIISCFFILALITFIIKATGDNLGWGFQFQNPYFLVFMIIILTLFIAELLGIFEITFGEVLSNLLNKKISEKEASKNIFIPNFLSGILAVLLATPCSAPFLGTAISFAITQDLNIIFLIFIFIGIGFASPYFILLISPKLINLLPKSGTWMNKIKQIMAGFLFATSIWLTYILGNNIGFLPTLIVVILTILIFFSLKIKTKVTKIIFISVLTILALTLPFDFHDRQLKIKNSLNSNWMNFDENILANLVSQNKIILVDVTADWCLTCKFNKLFVLDHPEIVNLLQNKQIIGLRADITKPDSEVMKFIAKHNRYAIPFNAIYGPNAKNGLLTSEFLNRKELLDLIKKAQ
jgi:suppressor for copper-sensitivity B